MTQIITVVCSLHLETDNLECEVKWALRSITMNKASGGDGITVELFQNLKDDAVKVLHSTYQQIWKTQQWPQDWKWSVLILIPKKGNAKECSNNGTVALISQASKLTSLKRLLHHRSSKASILWCSPFFIVPLSHPYMTTGKKKKHIALELHGSRIAEAWLGEF